MDAHASSCLIAYLLTWEFFLLSQSTNSFMNRLVKNFCVGLIVAALVFPAINIAEGQIFVTNKISGTIGEYNLDGSAINASLVTEINSDSLAGIAASGGDIFVVNNSTGTVEEYDAVTGAVVNDSLITGLNSALGIAISGSTLFVVNGGSTQNNGTIGRYVLGATPGTILSATPALIFGLSNP
jgi:hypothetical protein